MVVSSAVAMAAMAGSPAIIPRALSKLSMASPTEFRVDFTEDVDSSPEGRPQGAPGGSSELQGFDQLQMV